jgi:hypothetical protein
MCGSARVGAGGKLNMHGGHRVWSSCYFARERTWSACHAAAGGGRTCSPLTATTNRRRSMSFTLMPRVQILGELSARQLLYDANLILYSPRPVHARRAQRACSFCTPPIRANLRSALSLNSRMTASEASAPSRNGRWEFPNAFCPPVFDRRGANSREERERCQEAYRSTPDISSVH